MPALPVADPAPPDGRLPDSALSSLSRRKFGFYVHIPFCTVRCGYCDFNTYTASELGSGVSRDSFVDVLIGEIRMAREILPAATPPLSTVFIGGGTPTLLPAEQLGAVLAELRAEFGLAPDVEVTVEANPDTLAPAYLSHLLTAGVNRLSIGMQSAVPKILRVLNRTHTPGRPERAVAEALEAGFRHVNLDLIYGSPGETEADFQKSLDAAVGSGADHVSAYALVVEEGTALARQVHHGLLPAPDDDELADRYVQADATLTAAGFSWYEVSNWARTPAAACRHNELYWTGDNWWGLGPGAHSHVGGVRWWNVKHPSSYADLLAAHRSPAAGRETLNEQTQLMERIMLGVRRREGPGARLIACGHRASGARGSHTWAGRS